MNRLLIFGSASMTCCFKLQGARWNLVIFGTSLSIALRNLPVPRISLRSSLTQHYSLMELPNLMWMRSLSRLTICLPLIQQLHHCLVMLKIMLTHLFIFRIHSTLLHSIFTQIWLWVLQVLICILFYDLYICTLVFLHMMLSCVCPFWTLYSFWMRNNPSTELVLHNQHAHEEYDWELEHQHLAMEDFLPFKPPPFFPNIFGEPTIHDFTCVSSSMNAPIVDHSQD